MKRGLTLVETIVCISFLSIFSIVLIIIININKNINQNQFELYAINNQAVDFERSFDLLIEQYDNCSWYVSSTTILVNKYKIFEIVDNVCFFYYLDGITKSLKISEEFVFCFVNSNLIKFELVINDRLYTRYFFVGGRLYDD